MQILPGQTEIEVEGWRIHFCEETGEVTAAKNIPVEVYVDFVLADEADLNQRPGQYWLVVNENGLNYCDGQTPIPLNVAQTSIALYQQHHP